MSTPAPSPADDDPGGPRGRPRPLRSVAPGDALVESYRRRHLANMRSGDAAQAFLRRGPVAAWGDRAITSITKRDVVELLDSIVDKGSPLSANRTLAHVKALFTWAKARGVVEASPAEGVRPPVAERSRDRILTDDELVLFWKATSEMGIFGQLYRFLALTGQTEELLPAAGAPPR